MFEWIKKNITFIYISVAVIAFAAPWIFTQTWGVFGFSQNDAAIGNAFGGITAPFLNLLSATLLYMALKEQINANKIQDKALKEQVKANEAQTSMQYLLNLRSTIESQYSSMGFIHNNRMLTGDEAHLTFLSRKILDVDERQYASSFLKLIAIHTAFLNHLVSAKISDEVKAGFMMSDVVIIANIKIVLESGLLDNAKISSIQKQWHQAIVLRHSELERIDESNNVRAERM